MKRCVTRKRVCLFLLLIVAGAIVNIAVAWGIAAGHTVGPSWVKPAPQPEFVLLEGDEADVTGVIKRRLGVTFARFNFWPSNRQHDPAWMIADRPSGWMLHAIRDYGEAIDGYAVMASGVPLRTLWCDWADNWKARGGLQIDNSDVFPRRRALPLRPIWPGFAVNTLFYAVMLWLMFAAPFALRRRRRIKRGLCPKCAYPVGESAVCTECGAAVRSA